MGKRLDTTPETDIDMVGGIGIECAWPEPGGKIVSEGRVAAEPPKPKPGDPDYDWTPLYDGRTDLYTHTFGDGKVVALKPFDAIYSKTWLYKIRSLQTEADIQFAAIDRAACEQARAVLAELDDTTGDPLDELWKAWSAAARKDDDDEITAGN